MVINKWFDYFILIIILLNCICLSLDSTNPEEADTTLQRVINILDYVFLGIFTLEMVLKIIAMGFVMRPYTYLRDGWNIVSTLARLTPRSWTAWSSSSAGCHSN